VTASTVAAGSLARPDTAMEIAFLDPGLLYALSAGILRVSASEIPSA
jgi:hypothetical protein